MTSNEYYGGLNDRFELRASVLLKAGYAYKVIEIPTPTGITGTTGVFIRRRDVISAGTVMHAEGRAWEDELARVNR
jgi:V8-like Glu-specific endopeptidase